MSGPDQFIVLSPHYMINCIVGAAILFPVVATQLINCLIWRWIKLFRWIFLSTLILTHNDVRLIINVMDSKTDYGF